MDDIESVRMEELCRLVGGYSEDTIDGWVRKKTFPSPYVATPGGPRLWLVKDIELLV
jgi:predicted DNA-binding transcriptional regulator AlpA